MTHEDPMKHPLRHLLAAALLSMMSVLPCAAHAEAAAIADDLKPIGCGDCADWSRRQAPFNIHGNTWYVGPAGLSSVLVTGPQGHILVDGTLPESAQQVEANIRALGFRIEDVKLIVSSHPHYDHAGGIAYLARRSGAQVAAGSAAVGALASGRDPIDDPQYALLKDRRAARVAHVRGVHDGETLAVGPLRVTAHAVPGHTAGSTTWTWQSCEAGKCLDVVYIDSISPIAGPGFRFTGDATHPDLGPSFRASIAKVAALPCDIALSAHPGGTNMLEKAAARTPEHNPFIVPGECRTYAEEARRNLDARLAQERAEKP
jgi:metallo-beta-lactamase class B